ncbi:L,D-transpeptidase family protein [Microbacterium ureisolvens]|uniref:L,D-transpeptidase family protein n=1 Tax=Microbacterium ureisolvens TaxID=2781186 RepID=UPI003643E999
MATTSKGAQASAGDAVEAEQVVDGEASATAETTAPGEARAADSVEETDAATAADAETEDSVAPADDADDSPADDAEDAQAEAEDAPEAAVEEPEAAEEEPEAAAESRSAAEEPEAAAEEPEVTEESRSAAKEPEAAAEEREAPEEPQAAAEEPQAAAGEEPQPVDDGEPEADAAAPEPEMEASDAEDVTDAEAVEPEPAGTAEAADADPEAEAPAADRVEPEPVAAEAEAAEAEAAEPDAEPETAPQPQTEAEPEAEAGADTEAVAAIDTEAPADHDALENIDDATVAVPTAVLAPAAATAVAPVQTPAVADQTADTPATHATAPADGSGVFAWAPAEPKPKKKRTAIWIGAAAGVAVVGLVVSSLMLIAPGTTVAGVPVGWHTPGAAAEAIEQRLAETTVVLTGAGEDAEITGAELGAAVDAQALADAAFEQHPMWNPTAWFAATDAEVELDPAAATEALRDAAPQLYTDPVDATLAFDAATASYVATPAVPGAGVDVATVQAAIQAAFEAGESRVEVEPVPAEIPADISTETADATVTQLNGMLDGVGFYVGEERTVPVDRAVAASWLSVTPDGDAFAITADTAAIQGAVDGLAAAVNRPVENGRVITNSAGAVLREEAPGVSGRELGDTSTLAADFSAQLATGDAAMQVPVTVVEPVITTLARTIEVDLSAQTAHLFENGNLVRSYTISSGRDATPTPTGRFTVNAYTRIQDMGALCYNPSAVNSYCTEDVPWITWFAPDIAFHGASAFRSSLGFQQSHGCVNMWDADAKFVYDWTARGTEVWVHA